MAKIRGIQVRSFVDDFFIVVPEEINKDYVIEQFSQIAAKHWQKINEEKTAIYESELDYQLAVLNKRCEKYARQQRFDSDCYIPIERLEEIFGPVTGIKDGSGGIFILEDTVSKCEVLPQVDDSAEIKAEKEKQLSTILAQTEAAMEYYGKYKERIHMLKK